MEACLVFNQPRRALHILLLQTLRICYGKHGVICQDLCSTKIAMVFEWLHQMIPSLCTTMSKSRPPTFQRRQIFSHSSKSRNLTNHHLQISLCIATTIKVHQEPWENHSMNSLTNVATLSWSLFQDQSTVLLTWYFNHSKGSTHAHHLVKYSNGPEDVDKDYLKGKWWLQTC